MCTVGGGLYRSGMTGDAAVSGCSFAKNKAGQYGGAIYEANVADGSIAVSLPARLRGCV